MSEKEKFNVLNSIKKNEKIPSDRDTKDMLDYFERNGYIRKSGEVYQITEKGREYMEEF